METKHLCAPGWPQIIKWHKITMFLKFNFRGLFYTIMPDSKNFIWPPLDQ